MEKSGSIRVFFRGLNEETKEKIKKLADECRKNCSDGCCGMFFVEYSPTTHCLYVAYKQNHIPAFLCLKEKIKCFEHLIRTCCVDFHCEHRFEFDKFRLDVLSFTLRLEKMIENTIENEGLECYSVYVGSDSYTLTIRLDKFDEAKILKAIDCVERLNFDVLVLSEVI